MTRGRRDGDRRSNQKPRRPWRAGRPLRWQTTSCPSPGRERPRRPPLGEVVSGRAQRAVLHGEHGEPSRVVASEPSTGESSSLVTTTTSRQARSSAAAATTVSTPDGRPHPGCPSQPAAAFLRRDPSTRGAPRRSVRALRRHPSPGSGQLAIGSSPGVSEGVGHPGCHVRQPSTARCPFRQHCRARSARSLVILVRHIGVGGVRPRHRQSDRPAPVATHCRWRPGRSDHGGHGRRAPRRSRGRPPPAPAAVPSASVRPRRRFRSSSSHPPGVPTRRCHSPRHGRLHDRVGCPAAPRQGSRRRRRPEPGRQRRRDRTSTRRHGPPDVARQPVVVASATRPAPAFDPALVGLPSRAEATASGVVGHAGNRGPTRASSSSTGERSA